MESTQGTPAADERAAFEALVVQHQSAICAMAYSVLRDRARSEEVAQDALLIAWRDRATTPLTAAWLCGIARNLARNAARRRQEVAMSTEGEHVSTGERDARATLIEHEELTRAVTALERLPEAYRDALTIYYRADESYAAVATSLGISEATARQRVHRARERLRDRRDVVATTLRATRPGAAFTAAVVAAWAAGRVPSAAAATASAATRVPMPAWLIAAIGVGAVGTIAAIGVAIGTSASERTASRVAVTDVAAAPAATAPFASKRVAAPDTIAAGSQAGHSRQARPQLSADLADHMQQRIDFDFGAAPFGAVTQILGEQLELPLWSTIDPATEITLRFTRTPALEILDAALEQAGASRTEVPGIWISDRGSTDASSLGGTPVTLSVQGMPLAKVLELLQPHLGIPIGGVSHAKGASPLVTIDVRGEPAGAVLERLLLEHHLAYEERPGFVIEDAPE